METTFTMTTLRMVLERSNTGKKWIKILACNFSQKACSVDLLSKTRTCFVLMMKSISCD